MALMITSQVPPMLVRFHLISVYGMFIMCLEHGKHGSKQTKKHRANRAQVLKIQLIPRHWPLINDSLKTGPVDDNSIPSLVLRCTFFQSHVSEIQMSLTIDVSFEHDLFCFPKETKYQQFPQFNCVSCWQRRRKG